MAAAEESKGSDAKFPGVSVTDKNERCEVFLKCAGLAVKKRLIGSPKPSNGTIKVDFEKESVQAVITVDDKSGKSTVFEYNKNLPEDINPGKSSWEILKAERIKLLLVKEKPGSWERHSRYLQTKD